MGKEETPDKGNARKWGKRREMDGTEVPKGDTECLPNEKHQYRSAIRTRSDPRP